MRGSCRSLFLAIIFYASLVFSGWEESAFTLQSRLLELGFESVQIECDNAGLVRVRYENRMYRNEVQAAGIVLAEIGRADSTWIEAVLQPLHRGLVIAEMRVAMTDYRGFMDGSITAKELADRLVLSSGKSREDGFFSRTGLENSSFRKFDITVRPGTAIQLGNYDDRLKLNFNLMPQLTSTLWRGGQLNLEATVPVYDELELYTDEVRLSRFTVGQVLSLPRDGLVGLHVGGFHTDRYGAAGEAAYFLFHRSLLLSAAGQYTGFLLYQNSVWNYSDIEKFTWHVQARYFLPMIDFSIGVQYAEYLMGDKGWQVEANRVFRDTELGIYFCKTDEDQFGGVRISIPIPPKKLGKPARVRVVSPWAYELGYRATNKVYTIGAPVQTGVMVDPGGGIVEFYKRLNFGYIWNNLDLWKRME